MATAVVLLVVAGWRCPAAAITGHPCPGCGLTRALRLALHGDVAGATHMHPLVWIVVPFVAGWIGLELVGYLRTGAWGASSQVKHGGKLLLVVSALIFVVWIARFFGAFGGPAPV